MDKSTHDLITAILFIATAVPLILRLRKLKNKDLEVWCVRGIVAIFAMVLFATTSGQFKFLLFFTNVPMCLILMMLVCCIIDFEPPKRCKPERKVTNVSAVLPSDYPPGHALYRPPTEKQPDENLPSQT